MWYFDDIVCELHALEGHGLPLHACARTIHKSLKNNGAHKTINILKSKARAGTDQSSFSHNAHPILVDDIYDGHQLASMGSERDVGNTADLNEALEHLEKDTGQLHNQKMIGKEAEADGRTG